MIWSVQLGKPLGVDIHLHYTFLLLLVFPGSSSWRATQDTETTLGALEGLRVRDVEMRQFRTLTSKDTLARAVEELLAGSQQDFPVMDNESPVGMLRRNDLVKVLSEGRRDAAVSEGMCRDCETADEAASLQIAVESMRAGQRSTMPVVADGRMVDLVTLEIIGELITVSAATGRRFNENADVWPLVLRNHPS